MSAQDFFTFVFIVVVHLLVAIAIIHERSLKGMPGARTSQSRADMALVYLAYKVHPRIGDYVRATWDGTSEQLPSVLSSLIDRLDRKMRKWGLVPNREKIKGIVWSSITRHDVVPAEMLAEALKKVV